MSEISVQQAFQHVRQQLLAAREPGGWWNGELSASALSTATAISTLSFYLQSPAATDPAKKAMIAGQIESGIRWLAARQNEDGGWGDTTLSYSNISTTMLVIAAIHASGRREEMQDALGRACGYTESKGGIDGIRKRYGKDKTFAVPILANCAMAGLVPWKEVSALPFEAACVPQKFYHLMQLPVVSYAIPALVGIGIVKFELDPPWDPVRRTIRRLSIKRSLNVLDKMQPASGGFLEAVPLTSFVSMALIQSGRGDHPVVQNGLRFILDSFRPGPEDGEGSWPIDTNLATWVTTLSINALAGAPDEFPREPEDWMPCLEWLLNCQHTIKHPFTGAEPGGWGWSDLSGAVPDSDDTPGALIALHHLSTKVDFDDATLKRIRSAARSGVQWLVKLQNRDHGWPTFCRGWGKLPFDRSGTDLTAHAIRALQLWKNRFPDLNLDRAIERGFGYLTKKQRTDGSWLPLWFGNQDSKDDENPYYGTSKVLAAYRDSERFDTREARIGLKWLIDNANADGSWGGGESVSHSVSPATGKTGSVEETALVVELLLACPDDLEIAGEAVEAARRGLSWILEIVQADQIDNCWPIGFYFAKLWYFEKLYPLIFATAALATATAKRQESAAVDSNGKRIDPVTKLTAGN